MLPDFGKPALVDQGFLTDASVQELASVGIYEYQTVFTSHHTLVYRRINDDIYVYAIASHRQNFQTLLIKRISII
jgi:hypothetical protein